MSERTQVEVDALLEQARWFVQWIEASNITPRQAGMDVQAKKWLPRLGAYLSRPAPTGSEARLREALERIVADAEGCERLPQPNAYDFEAAMEKAVQDLLLDHADIARAALAEGGE